MFPFSIKYCQTIQYKTEYSEQIIAGLYSYIIKNKGQNVEKSNNKIIFHISILGWSWDKFSLIEKGIFTVNDSAISFEFFMYRHFIIVSIIALSVLYATQLLWLGIFIFLLLGVLNWVIALITYKKMLRDITKSVPITFTA